MKEKIKAYFKENREAVEKEIIDLLERMVKERTVNVAQEKLSEHPYLEMRGEEYRVAEIVKDYFDRIGMPYVIHERTKGRTNIIGRLGRDENDKRLFMAAHLDIVPAGDGWDTDPFSPVLKEGFLYGRGVLDNKGPLCSALVAARVLKEVVGGENIAGELQVAGLADEEAMGPDGDYGIGYLLDEKLINPTYAIIPDVGENMKKIDIAEKGRIEVKVTARGVQAHGSTPERGVNAIFKMARFLAKLEEMEMTYTTHPVLGGPTMNLGEVHGGAAPNIVPGECSAIIDFRLVPGQTADGMRKQVEELALTVADDFSAELLSATEPHEISPDNDLIKAIQANSADYLDFKPEPFGLGGGTFAKTLNLAGITAVGFGPGDDTAFHVANERVELAQLVDFACLISLVSLDLL